MSNERPDPELLRLLVALKDLCRSQDIELVAAARVLGGDGVLVSRVGSDKSVLDLLDTVRASLSADGQDKFRH